MDAKPILCIFRSVRTDHSDDDYEEWSRRMSQLVATMPGYLSHFSVRDPATREGVTVSYFADAVSMERWRSQGEHLEAQALGRADFYEEYSIEVATLQRRHRWRRED